MDSVWSIYVKSILKYYFSISGPFWSIFENRNSICCPFLVILVSLICIQYQSNSILFIFGQFSKINPDRYLWHKSSSPNFLASLMKKCTFSSLITEMTPTSSQQRRKAVDRASKIANSLWNGQILSLPLTTENPAWTIKIGKLLNNLSLYKKL